MGMWVLGKCLFYLCLFFFSLLDRWTDISLFFRREQPVSRGQIEGNGDRDSRVNTDTDTDMDADADADAPSRVFTPDQSEMFLDAGGDDLLSLFGDGGGDVEVRD